MADDEILRWVERHREQGVPVHVLTGATKAAERIAGALAKRLGRAQANRAMMSFTGQSGGIGFDENARDAKAEAAKWREFWTKHGPTIAPVATQPDKAGP